jgi:GrpB-like predicted nucleotidyltransferase (UPF0157 family)
MSTKIILVEHRESWLQDFEEENILLQSVFDNREHSIINHIGSTCIPNIIAKPIVDINIALHELKNEEEYIYRLKEIKYYYSNGSQMEEWILFHKIENGKRFHLHLLEEKSKRYQEQIIFKNFLLKDPEFAKNYEKIKIHATYDDHCFYCMNKKPFLEAFFKGYWGQGK